MARNYDAEKQKIINDMLAKGASKYEAEQISQDQINAAKQGNTAFDQVTDDEASLSAQRDSMSRYREMADNGGFTAADRSAQNQASKQISQQDNGRRQAILQEMQARGTSGGGSELAARLAGADSSAAQNADASQQIAARGEAKRDQAIAASGQLAGQMRDQSYRQQANLATARDGVSRFNADLQGRATMQNTNANNQAGQYNAGADERYTKSATELQYNNVVEAQRAKIAEDEAKKKKKSGMGAAIGGIAGAAIGTYIAPGVGTAAGASAGSALGGAMFAHGGKVEGPEVVEGDDPANDVVQAWLSPGEVVVPKSHAKDPKDAARFVAEANGDEPEVPIEETILAIASALSKLKGR